MKGFLVVCFMSITFFSQGWGGKHYLVKTKEKGKYAKPEAGHDYNDYENDEDVEYNDDNAVDDNVVDDVTYDDDTHDDDDTYDDENNGEEFDVESFIEDNLEEGAKNKLNELDGEKYEEALEIIKEAANNRGSGADEDYNHSLAALKLLLGGARDVLQGILMILGDVTSSTLSTYIVTDCESNCRSQCKEYSYSRSSSSKRSRKGRRGKGRKKKNKGYKKYITRTSKSCRNRCRTKCKGREW